LGNDHHGRHRLDDLVQARCHPIPAAWAVDVATTIHYYEAILACLAIVVWHFIT
jgi:hypothetical protein